MILLRNRCFYPPPKRRVQRRTISLADLASVRTVWRFRLQFSEEVRSQCWLSRCICSALRTQSQEAFTNPVLSACLRVLGTDCSCEFPKALRFRPSPIPMFRVSCCILPEEAPSASGASLQAVGEQIPKLGFHLLQPSLLDTSLFAHAQRLRSPRLMMAWQVAV